MTKIFKTIDIDKKIDLSARDVYLFNQAPRSIEVDQLSGEYVVAFPYGDDGTRSGYVVLYAQSPYFVSEVSKKTYREFPNYGTFYYPMDAKLDYLRRKIWVADTGNHRVVKIDINSGEVDFEIKDAVLFPHSIAVDLSSGGIAVKGYSDFENGAVRYFNASGELSETFVFEADFPWSEFHSATEESSSSSRSTEISSGKLIVADRSDQNSGVYVLDQDGKIDVVENTLLNPVSVVSEVIEGKIAILYDNGTEETQDKIQCVSADFSTLIGEVDTNVSAKYYLTNNKVDDRFLSIFYNDGFNKQVLQESRFDVPSEGLVDSLASNFIEGTKQAFKATKSGKFYVLANNGKSVLILDANAVSVETTIDISSYGIFDIMKHDFLNDNIWVAGTGHTNVLEINGTSFNVYSSPIIPDDIEVAHTTEVGMDYLFIIGEDRLYQMNYGDGSFIIEKIIRVPQAEYVKIAYQPSSDILWIATSTSVYKYEVQTIYSSSSSTNSSSSSSSSSSSADSSSSSTSSSSNTSSSSSDSTENRQGCAEAYYGVMSDPVFNGPYSYIGQYNGKPYYYDGSTYYIYWNGGSTWLIGTSLGGPYNGYGGYEDFCPTGQYWGGGGGPPYVGGYIYTIESSSVSSNSSSSRSSKSTSESSSTSTEATGIDIDLVSTSWTQISDICPISYLNDYDGNNSNTTMPLSNSSGTDHNRRRIWWVTKNVVYMMDLLNKQLITLDLLKYGGASGRAVRIDDKTGNAFVLGKDLHGEDVVFQIFRDNNRVLAEGYIER